MKAVYAGSFDPFTNGHLSVVTEAAELFDEVIILVASNQNKHRMFRKDTMAFAIVDCMHNMGLDNVQVIISEDLTADVCRQMEAQYLVRGLRNTTDYMYEEEIAKFNQRVNPSLKTIYIRAVDDAISSSMVRELWLHDKNVIDYVPAPVFKLMKERRDARNA